MRVLLIALLAAISYAQTESSVTWEKLPEKGKCVDSADNYAYVSGYSWIGSTTNDDDSRWSSSTDEYNRCREVCEGDPDCTGYQQSGTQDHYGGSGNCVIFNVPLFDAQDDGSGWGGVDCYRKVDGDETGQCGPVGTEGEPGRWSEEKCAKKCMDNQRCHPRCSTKCNNCACDTCVSKSHWSNMKCGRICNREDVNECHDNCDEQCQGCNCNDIEE